MYIPSPALAHRSSKTTTADMASRNRHPPQRGVIPTAQRPRCPPRRHVPWPSVAPAGVPAYLPSMDWDCPAIVLAARPYSEGDLIVAVMTEEHGLHRGLARGGASRAQAALWQAGN